MVRFALIANGNPLARQLKSVMARRKKKPGPSPGCQTLSSRPRHSGRILDVSASLKLFTLIHPCKYFMGARFGCKVQASRNSESKNVCTTEQFYVFTMIRIAARMESPPFHLGRKHMKYRLALLIGGIILSTAVPIWCDSIHSTRVTIERSGAEFSGSEHSSFTGFAGIFGLAASDRGAQFHGLSEFDSSVLDSSIFTTAGAWHGFGHGHGRRDDGKGQGWNSGWNDSPTVLVPEPGAISLLLVGMAAVGTLARRRGELPVIA